MADADKQERRVMELKHQLSKLEPTLVGPTLDVLKQLDAIEITFVKVLQRTDIGRVVGNLRKHTDAGVSAAARDLVNKWKKLLPATPSGSGSASASASSSPAVSRAPSVAPAATPTPKPTPTPAPATGADGAADPNASQDLLSPSASQDSLAAASSAFAAKIDPVVTKQLKDAVSRAQLSDPLRSKMAELLGDALLVNIPTDDEGGVAAVDTVATAALAIEAQAFVLANRDWRSSAYKDKVRSLVSNLRHADNADLRWRVISGELTAVALCAMSRIELAPAQKRQEIEEHKKKNTMDAMEAKPIESVTDAFQCGRCKGRKCTYYQKQTRSADEPMTTFVQCTICGNRWKFS